MLGTLVLILPAAFTGGAMVIEHGDARATYSGSGRQLTFVAFYADCHHEVRPVTTGHRVVLTYNLTAKAVEECHRRRRRSDRGAGPQYPKVLRHASTATMGE